jgi:hypothetical protein
MILKRIEKEGEIKAIYESSNILASTYNPTTKSLIVTFKRGDQYAYNGVSDTDYLRFETAESQGKILNGNIKKYEFEKLDAVDTKKLLAEIDKIKNQEIIEFEEVIINHLKNILLSHASTGDINQKDLEMVGKMNTKLTELKGVTEPVNG